MLTTPGSLGLLHLRTGSGGSTPLSSIATVVEREAPLQITRAAQYPISIYPTWLRVTMTDARHSSGFVDNGQMVYMGEPAGYVLTLEDGRTIYYAGDTCLFGDMKLIGELYKPEIAFLPIGDRFTMGPDTAAMAAKWLGVRQVVPMHFGTVPLLTGTPEAFQDELQKAGVKVEPAAKRS